ncbi:MAG: squalene synthase HpnC [Geminicoccaceae bacterium]
MTDAVEAASGKGAGEENFPVGSWLIAAPLRPHIAVFYAFARAADDIADNPALAPEDKVARLDALAAGLDGRRDDEAVAKAVRMRASLAATDVDRRHCHDLLDAFRQDATKRRYADWGELMGYCARSASPVGRYLLDLHGEDRAIWTASDALCDALQVLNHLQDCAADYRDLDRVYLPQDWLEAEGSSVADLTAPASTPGLRRVLDLCLDRTARLIDRARPLAARLRSTRLALESAVIVGVAEHLERALRKGDPIAERVQLSKPGFLHAALSGSLRHALLPRLGLTPALEGAR